MLCLVCNKNEAIKHEKYGVMPCKECQSRQSLYKTPVQVTEITTEEIKEQRKMFSDDIIQPFRGGEVSKEFIKKHGHKQLGISDKEAKKAKNVWHENSYYKND